MMDDLEIGAVSGLVNAKSTQMSARFTQDYSASESAWIRPVSDAVPVMASPVYTFSTQDTALLERVQADAFGYFLEYVNPANGLIADSSRAGSSSSIAAVGFALSCYPIAVERGWLDRKQAAELTLSTLQFFADSHQDENDDSLKGDEIDPITV